MVTTLAGTGTGKGGVAETASGPDARAGVETLLDGVGDATGEPSEPAGALGLVRALRDPEVQFGTGYLVAVARAIHVARAERDAVD